jgi:UDP-N-acetylmuramoyl-L-alanyl-D-glutamate--2,6-diaminopimelate ligase
MEGRTSADLGVRLRTLLADAEIVGADDVSVGQCAVEAHLCRSGDVYFALGDDSIDGHDRAAEAVRYGASAVVASRPISVNAPVCYVPDVREAYGRVCHALAGNPSQKLPTIAVAGSFGKTTAGYLIASVLQAAGRTPGVIGSLGYCDGEETAEARWSTPPPPVAAAWLSRMSANGCTHAVVEASSRGLAQGHTAGMQFDACCLTNLYRDAIRSDGRRCDDRPLASRLLEQLSPEGVLIANVDDAGSAALAAEHEGPVITVGLNAAAELSATLLERCRWEQTFLISFGNEVVPVRTRLVGPHNLSHCLLAAAVGTVYGIAPDVIVRGLESVRELPGRLERIECGQPFGVFLEEARSPAALEVCLETLRGATERRLRCIYATDSVVAETKEHATLGGELQRVIHRWCDDAIVIGRNAASRGDYRRQAVAERADAIGRALREAESGDCLLIVGGGEPSNGEAEHSPVDWDDRQFVRRWLYQRYADGDALRRTA